MAFVMLSILAKVYMFVEIESGDFYGVWSCDGEVADILGHQFC